MEERGTGTKEKKELYEYREFPKNVRQIGVPLPGAKIYLEDYVITYLKQTFVEMNESKVVILLGRRGTQKAEKGIFIYGAVALEEENILENGKIEKETWDRVYEIIHQDFMGSQVLGWACGIGIWNSEADNRVKKLQKESFAREESVMFLWDLCEKEEKIFSWQRGMLKEMSGYYVYFEKNPQMQDFMLDKQKVESIDGDYCDTVTSSMRHVMEEKEEEKQRHWQIITYCGAVAAGIAILFGVHMMMDSTARIKSMEQTVDALSQYVGESQKEIETMSRQAENKVKQIPYENQNTEEPDGGKKTDKKTEGKKENGSAVDETEKKVQEEQTEKGKDTSDSGNSTEGHTTQQMMKHQAQSYIVQKGDTLSQIVWKQYHDFSYEKKVKKANGIKNKDKIYEGQRLILPAFEE